MARDFRPKEKKDKQKAQQRPSDRAASSSTSTSSKPSYRQAVPSAPNRNAFTSNQNGQRKTFGPSGSSSSSHKQFSKDEQGQDENDDEADDGSDSADEGALREAIAALGGDEADLDLVSSKSLKRKGKSKGGEEVDEASLGQELRGFMKGLKFDVPEAAVLPATSKKDKTAADKVKAVEKEQVNGNAAGKEKKSRKEMGREAGPSAKDQNPRQQQQQQQQQQQSTSAVSQSNSFAPTPSSSSKNSSELLLEPTTRWMSTTLPELAPSASSSSNGAPEQLGHHDVASLLSLGTSLLEGDNAKYHAMLHSGSSAKMASLGGLTPSDAKFIASLLGDTSSLNGSAAKGGTLSDRIAAHALLLGSSPAHNLRSLDALIGMSAKKSREESGRATRALADWFANAGLGSGRKLRYFRDQPQLLPTAKASPSQARDQRLALFAFEDQLKKTYFTFLQTLETQSHDTLPFVRQQAVTQIYILLKEKSEQEQNLLRLLVNKLGDGERSVASKSMNHLLELLNTHPAMKGIVAQEVGDLIRKPSRSSSRVDNENTKKHHNHAKYYGVLTLNQIILTRQDSAVANSLIALYFELFESSLSHQKDEADKVADGGEEEAPEPAKKEKNRWRNQKKGAKNGKAVPNAAHAEVAEQELESRMTAAVLTGVRRAFPFAALEASVFDGYLSSLFRITHSASFNIAVQALQLIYVIATSSSTASASLLDRFHSTLYSSLLDPRLGTTSKTAMYLNLVFKAMKEDVDDERRAAEVKRLIQLLSHMEVDFVCGALFLVAELVRAHPRLAGMMTEPEDDDEERILDPPDEEDGDDAEKSSDASSSDDGKAQRPSKPILPHLATTAYDPLKRDPRYTHARQTCLWDLLPLTTHFHPTVRLLTQEVLSRKTVLSTKPDLSLYSLSHFLDKFVYRNPKSRTTDGQKGASNMQPSVSLSTSSLGGADGNVRKVKGWRGDDGVAGQLNTEKFWKKKVAEVPVDSIFFHQFFNLRQTREAAAGGKRKGKGKVAEEVEDDNDDDEDEDDIDDDVSIADESEAANSDADIEVDAASASNSDEDSDDEEEAAIWAEMKRTMPREDGDSDLADSASDGAAPSDDDSDLEKYDYTDSEQGDEGDEEQDEEQDDDEDDDEDLAGLLDDDDDDLLPFTPFSGSGPGSGSESDPESDSESKSKQASTKGKKRSAPTAAAGGDDDEGEVEEEKALTKSQLARRERKKRRGAAIGAGGGGGGGGSAFASAEDYAHLFGAGGGAEYDD